MNFRTNEPVLITGVGTYSSNEPHHYFKVGSKGKVVKVDNDSCVVRIGALEQYVSKTHLKSLANFSNEEAMTFLNEVDAW